MKLYEIYEQVGVPASSLSQLRGPWPGNVEDPCVYRVITPSYTKQKKYKEHETADTHVTCV